MLHRLDMKSVSVECAASEKDFGKYKHFRAEKGWCEKYTF